MNWYGFLIALGMILCVILAYFCAKRRGIEGDTVIDIIISGLPFAIIFARIYYVVFDLINPNGQHWTFTKFIGIDDHGLQGLAIYGALIGVVIGLFILSLWKNRKKVPQNKRISYLQLLDLTFAFVMLGQGIGRWGNFSNQEAHGYAITDPLLKWFPMGVKVGGTWYYATFFYEFLWDIAGFGLLLFLYIGKRKSFDGFIFSGYCIFYGLGRVWIEGMREDSLWLVPPTNIATGAGGVRVSQLVSVLIIIFGIAFIVAHIVRAKKAGKKVFIFVEQSKLDSSYFGYESTKLAHPMPDIKFRKKRGELDGEQDEARVREQEETKQSIEAAQEKEREEQAEKPVDIQAEDNKKEDNKKDDINIKTEETEAYEDRWDD